MENISNKIIYIVGAMLCVFYIVIPCGEGLLGDGITNAMGYLNANTGSMLALFILPTLLLITAIVLLVFKKTKMLGFAIACLGAILFLVMDIKFAANHQAYLGCYINAIGAVIAMAGAALCAFETELQEEEEEDVVSVSMSDYYGETVKETPAASAAPIVFTDTPDAPEISTTDFYSEIENLFIDENDQEERENEIKESIGNIDIDGHGDDDHDYSNDSFWS